MPQCPVNTSNIHESLQVLQLIVSFVVLMNVLYSVYGFCSDPLRETYEKKIAELEDRLEDEINRAEKFEVDHTDLLDDLCDLKRNIGTILNKNTCGDSHPKKRRREESDDSD
jgi:hypothetical protein